MAEDTEHREIIMNHLLTASVLAGVLAVSVLADDGEFELLEQEVHKLAVSSAQITAQEAILIAMKTAPPKSMLVEVELFLKGETPVFDMEFLSGTGEHEIVVDAISGNVLDTEEADEEEGDAEDELDIKALQAANVSLFQAIGTALDEVKGATVVGAEAELEGGNVEYEVTLLADGVFKEVELDADGKVTEVEQEEAEGFAWTYDHDPTGKPPAGWIFDYTNPSRGKATWTVRNDLDAYSGLHVLTVKTASGGRVFNVAMASETSYKDVNVRTRIRANAGRVDQGGGVLWRCKDTDNYYVCRINPLENNFRVYKVVGGRRKQLQSCRIELTTGKWYAVRAMMVGDHITCYVDGQKRLDVHDDTFADAGMVGLWTKADASSSFDNDAAQAARADGDDHDEGEDDDD
jgi:uncharacterized membrane protein YkoI